jgi:hypothetical protein
MFVSDLKLKLEFYFLTHVFYCIVSNLVMLLIRAKTLY